MAGINKRQRVYSPESAKLLRVLATLGATTAQMAEALSIHPALVKQWMDRKPGLGDLIRKCKEEADGRVVRSLWERATGYTHTTKKRAKDGAVANVEEHYPPDVAACIFWLKNRQPGTWRNVNDDILDPDKQQIDPKLIAAARKVAAALNELK